MWHLSSASGQCQLRCTGSGKCTLRFRDWVCGKSELNYFFQCLLAWMTRLKDNDGDKQQNKNELWSMPRRRSAHVEMDIENNRGSYFIYLLQCWELSPYLHILGKCSILSYISGPGWNDLERWFWDDIPLIDSQACSGLSSWSIWQWQELGGWRADQSRPIARLHSYWVPCKWCPWRCASATLFVWTALFYRLEFV